MQIRYLKSFARPFFFAAALGVALPAMAQGHPAIAGKCRTVYWKPGDIVYVQAQIYKQVHVQLPEEAIDVIGANKNVWDMDFIKNHLFLTPTNANPLVAEATATVVGASGNTYEFLIRRVSSITSHCTVVDAGGALVNRAAWQRKADGLISGTDEYTASAVRQVQAQHRESEKNLERQARDALKKYRKQIYTQYAWNAGTGFLANAGGIESVYDDGRWTYVRLGSDAGGLMSVLAKVDGKQELLQYDYDPATKVYQISGLFPEFVMRSGQSEVKIVRKGGG